MSTDFDTPGTYDVLAADGTVWQYGADQFEQFAEARSRDDRERLVGEGWTPLDERIEPGRRRRTSRPSRRRFSRRSRRASRRRP